MSGIPDVERQFREIRSYDLFYSVMTRRATPCLKDLGWYIVRYFAEIEDTYTGVTVNPDFVLYDGRVCWFVELKSGNNVNDGDIRQMAEYDNLSIDGVEDEVQDSNVREDTPHDGTVEEIETSIIYQDIDDEWLHNCRNNWDDCRENLERLEAETAVLTQRHGGRLRRLAGDFRTNTVASLFDEDIHLPWNPKEEILLTEQMEKETLAVAICGIWGEQAIDYEQPVEVNVNMIRDFFAPRFNISPEKVNRVLYYLHAIGACTYIDDLDYEFSKGNLREVISIKATVRDERVSDRMSRVSEDSIPDAGQMTLDESLAGDESVADGGESTDSSDDTSSSVDEE